MRMLLSFFSIYHFSAVTSNDFQIYSICFVKSLPTAALQLKGQASFSGFILVVCLPFVVPFRMNSLVIYNKLETKFHLKLSDVVALCLN